ncbi:MAG: hypothetical protein JNM71_17590 [Flavobacterium lindanitolerans]|uniref:Uncharacterized protein n=1 Tax=Flavobacterium microcysteis TaxID=2596891 RepID=A0A501Q0S6_9FLAO|nr:MULTISPECIES: hypothetical protein [Flavobacterium]MBL7869827.1 hypothetical protein [Flavobacterium lindanitolerans]TPD66005.1 hypothetical protein FJA49_17665 [Flavobacterium microcysteis]
MRKIIQLLPVENWKYLRVIQLSGKEWNPFTGFLAYYREYAFPEFDQLDNAILESLRSFNVNAEYFLNEEILLENQAEIRLEKYESELSEIITIQINPKVNEELYKLAKVQDVYYYPREFKVEIFKGFNYTGINKYFHAYLEHKDLEKLISTITPIR